MSSSASCCRRQRNQCARNNPLGSMTKRGRRLRLSVGRPREPTLSRKRRPRLVIGCFPRSFRRTKVFPNRYLVRFGPKQTQHLFTDVLIIGGGIAGLRAALEVPRNMRVLVVTKDRVQLSNSSYAQGGIAGGPLAGGPLRESHRGHAHRRRRPVRPGHRRESGARGAGADRRPDPLRRPVRRGARRHAKGGTAITASFTPSATPPASR